jgi:glycerophosphoryl diester phosphodiesterase
MPDDHASVASLLSAPYDAGDHSIAARHAPIIRFDSREPFLPLAAGFTVFRHSGPSQSFSRGRMVDLQPPEHLAVEYAIWWDWDIGHLYELEHIWVFVDKGGRVVRAEASWHGGFHDMSQNGRLALDGERPVVFSEPGKHAFAPTPDWFRERRATMKRSETGALAGAGGVLIAPYISGAVKPSPLKTRLAHSYLAQHAFEPSWDFSRVFPVTADMLVPWPALCSWMPQRVNAILDRLAAEMKPAEYRFLRIGHRGAAAHAPDNTLLGIRSAAALGADAVEFDVRQTVDGQTVLSHDEFLVDAAGNALIIRRTALANLRSIDVGSGERIPTLAEALDACKQEMLGAYIEIKDAAAAPPTLAALKDQGYADRCILASFQPGWLANVKAVAPAMPTSILFGSPHVDAVMLAQSIKANFVHPCWEWLSTPSALLTLQWVQRTRAADLGIISWHEERPQEIAALRLAGLDGICSDAPELLL